MLWPIYGLKYPCNNRQLLSYGIAHRSICILHHMKRRNPVVFIFYMYFYLKKKTTEAHALISLNDKCPRNDNKHWEQKHSARKIREMEMLIEK